MKFGVREICDVTFKALQGGKMGSMTVIKGQPVLFIDSAKTSVIEGAATTTYATGGRGNARLIAWEGEKTLTFTVEDALLSEVGFAILSGAGLFDETNKNYQVHCTEICYPDDQGNLTVERPINDSAPVFCMEMQNGSITKMLTASLTGTSNPKGLKVSGLTPGAQVFVDYYTTVTTGVSELSIDAENFAGYYYVEGSTLFRRESDGVDLPAEIIFPKVKIQSNFTFNMASSGDPSTFTFTMDALPAYTWFEKTKKVLCAIQIIKPEEQEQEAAKPVTTLDTNESSSLEEDGLGE